MRDIAETLGGLPAREPDPASSNNNDLVITDKDKDGNYPDFTGQFTNIVYWGKRLKVTGKLTSVGSQSIGVGLKNTGVYFINKAPSSYIPPGTQVSIFKIGSIWFANYADNQVYLGTAAEDIALALDPTHFDSPQINVTYPGVNGSAQVTLPVSNPQKLNFPNKMPVQMGISGGVLVLTGPTSIVVEATLNADINPFATGPATPIGPLAILGQVQVTDRTGGGGSANRPAIITFDGQATTGWSLVSTSLCTPQQQQ